MHLHLFVGNIGTGKTTLAIAICEELLSQGIQFEHLDMDKLSLDFSLDSESVTPSDFHKFDDHVRKLFIHAVNSKNQIILDGNFLEKSSRQFYICHANMKGYHVTCYDFGRGSELSKSRRTSTDDHFLNVRNSQLHDEKSISYAVPDKSEGIHEIITR